MYATSPLRNAGVFEALLRLSCMTVPSECMAVAVPGRRRTAVESQTTTRLFTRVFEVGGRGSFLQFLRERAIERPGHLMSKGSRVASATRNDLTVTVAVLKVACEQWWSGRGIGWEFVHVCIDGRLPHRLRPGHA